MPARTIRAPFEMCLIALLLAGAAIAVAGRLFSIGDGEMTVWGDRDLWRAMDAFRHWPVLGPETNSGIQTPGGAFYLLLAGFLAVHPSITAAGVGVVLFFAASMALLGTVFAREVSPLAGALVAATFAGSGLLFDNLGIWNPGYIDLFATVTSVGGYYFVRYGSAAALGVAAAALALGMQVHLQMVELAIGIAIATVLFRPRLRWPHAVALVVGLVLPYLPALLSGGFGVVLTALSVPGDAVSAYVFLDAGAWQKAELLYNLLAGSSDSFARAATGWFSRAGIALAVGDLLVAVLVLVFLLRLLPGRLGSGRPRVFAVFAVIALTYVVVLLFTFLTARHLVAAVPAVAAVIGLAAEEIVIRLRRSGRAGGVAACVLCGLIAARPAALGAAQLLNQDFTVTSIRAQAEIAATLKPGFYPDHESFENHAALFWRGPDGSWLMAQGRWNNRMAFIYRTAAVPMAATARTECVTIVSKTDATGDPRAELASFPTLSGLAPVFAPAAMESAHFVYFPYTARDGNCLKTFSNAYIPSAFETAHLPPGAAAGAMADDGAAVFVVPHPGSLFPLGVEIRREGDSYVAALQGRLLRGYTGLYFLTVLAPTLCLVGDAGAIVVPFGGATVGSPQLGMLAPWWSSRFDLVGGRYEVWLNGRDGRQPISIAHRLGSLTVPDIAAALPTDRGEASAPAACAPRSAPRRPNR